MSETHHNLGELPTAGAGAGARLHAAPALLLEMSRNFWWWLRQVFGDAAYENYVKSVQAQPQGGKHCEHHPQGAVSEQEFYLDRLRRKHSSGPNCCC